MSTATRSNGFPNLVMTNSNDERKHSMNSSFGHTPWRADGIWGNGPSIGSSRSTHRDTSGPRVSDDSAPSGLSGSAQLNPHSEAVPWTPRSDIWNQAAHHGHSKSGSASPTRTRDGFPTNSNIFQPRGSIGQTVPSLPSRTVPPGPADTAANPFSLGSTRPGNSGARQTDGDLSTPASRYGDTSSYPFTKVQGLPSSQSHRPSSHTPSMSLSHEPGRQNTFTYGSIDEPVQDLGDSLRRSLTLDNNPVQSSNGFPGNGFPNATTQPFQLNPSSRPWQQNLGPHTQSFGLQQDTWGEAPLPSSNYASLRRANMVPVPHGTFRPLDSSPSHFAGTPTHRGDHWNRPNSRDPRAYQEYDRQQLNTQYLPQTPGFYTPPYYNAHLQQFSGPYDQYLPSPGFRNPVQLPSYGVPVNYIGGIPLPVRPSRDQDPAKGQRSALLDEFRGTGKGTKRFELKDIYDYIVEFSGDQHGSRFIQEKLQTANSDEKDQVFREIEPNALQLMRDVFGNYVIQKFFEHGNQVQKKMIAAQMKGQVAELSMQMYACRVVQKALEHVLVDQQTEIVDELKPDIMRIIKDANGNHVIQKIIQMVPRLCIPFIMEALRGQVEALASHNYGCRVIQRILEHGTDEERLTLMADLHGCATKLITDQYGNYVTQHIIAHGSPEDRARMIRLVIDRLVPLSKHKFASNVVEKSIEHGTSEERSAIRAKLTAMNPDGTSPLQLMMKDQFGNYVIQKLMGHLDGDEREAFVDQMRPQVQKLKALSSGRQITVLDRLMSSATTPSVHAESSPSTPNMGVDNNSVAPTPSLTMEQNSPQSSSPPSTNISTVEETGDGKPNNTSSTFGAQARLAVQGDEA
ncbi:armadillo-type protein [Xylariomycetidae sp. FL0641]|nr:armadillo-type protein [Xylariomycetidae sp. FL0641]